MADRREQFDDPEEALRAAMEGALAGVWTALPCVITAVDLTRQTVSAQPSVKGTQQAKDGTQQQVSLPMLVDVPICWPRGGGFALTLPVAIGDECLVVFASRCIDAWWQSGGEQNPVEDRMHDLSDGFAIFAPTSQPKKLSNVQSDGIELRTDDRSKYIKLSATGITIVGDITHTGNVTQTGNITQTGNTTSTGTITGTTDVIGGGKSLKTHTHTTTVTGMPTSAPN